MSLPDPRAERNGEESAGRFPNEALPGVHLRHPRLIPPRPEGTSRDVGCSTVREVLHWLPGGDLATRTADKLYVVGPRDCTTQMSHDARHMHPIHYAPNAEKMAYIHRELTYDRSAEEYLPDSSLVLSGP